MQGEAAGAAGAVHGADGRMQVSGAGQVRRVSVSACVHPSCVPVAPSLLVYPCAGYLGDSGKTEGGI